MGFQFVLDSISHKLGYFHNECPGWRSWDGVFLLIPRNNVSFAFPYSVQWIVFLSSPVCVQRK